ncbi:hypothetical protein C5167_017757 [Papaver somniferum]|uniref:Phosphoglycerate kinase n=1 Tax=Papaver somniferum TaxID=3469 RepID=A0A4Y7INN2_PAPSO|nr:hypothetical protein C5167_017757 [Papaver somniferum]
MAPNCVGEDVEQMVAAIPDGGVLLLESVRTHRGEVENFTKFSKKLASLADLYVNDAFCTTLAAHASIEGVAKLLKPAVAGLLMKQEFEYLVGAVAHNKKPFAAIVGGSKLSMRKTIEALLDKVDILLLGGTMIFTFWKAQGCRIGSSLVEESMFGPAKSILQMAKKKKVHLVIPLDFLVRRIGPPHDVLNATIALIPNGWRGADVGPASINMFTTTVSDAKTVIWIGSIGAYATDGWPSGTEKIAKCLADLSGKGVTTIVAGGASRGYLQSQGLADKISHISMGGPILPLLEGRLLPGLVALDDYSDDDKGEDSRDKRKKRSAETSASKTPADKKAKLRCLSNLIMSADGNECRRGDVETLHPAQKAGKSDKSKQGEIPKLRWLVFSLKSQKF